MRKFLTILFFFISLVTFGQNATGPQAPLPNWNYIGSPTTLSEVKGVLNPRYGIILSRYADTVTANLNAYIKSYPGMQIVVGDTIWFRNSTATEWLKASGGSTGSGSGSVVNFTAGNLSPLFTTNVTNPTTSPALTFSLSTQSANVVFAGPATGSAAAPTFRSLVAADISGLVTASEGVSISGLDLQLFGPIATPAQLTTERSINLRRNILHFNNSENSTTSGGPIWQFTNRPFSPFQFFSTDTLSANNIDPPTAALPLSGIFGRRTMYYADGIFTTQKIYGHSLGIVWNWKDSMRFRTEGGDYNAAFIAESRFTPRGTGPQRTGHNGTGNNNLPYYGVPTILSNTILEHSGSNTIHTYGWMVGVSSYLVAGALDTVERFSFFQTNNFLNAATRVKKYYGLDFQHNQGSPVVDSAYGIWDQYGYRHYLRGNTVIGFGTNWATSDQLKVWGNVNISDSLHIGKASLIGDSTGFDFLLRRRTDGGVFRIRADLASLFFSSGGSSFLPTTGTGTATGNIIGSLAGSTLNIQQGANPFLTLDPTAGAEVAKFVAYNTTAGDNQSGVQALTTNSNAYSQIFAGFNGSTEVANIELNASVAGSTITSTADTHTFNIGGGTPSKFVVTHTGVAQDLLSLEASNSYMKAFDATGGGNQAGVDFVASSTDATNLISADFNGGANIASIELFADNVSSTIEMKGQVFPSTDDVFALGNDTHRWSDIFLGPASIHIGTSTSDEGVISYNTTTNVLSLTSTGVVSIPSPFTLGAVSVLPTGTELNFVDGVTSSIQTQLDGKANTALSNLASVAVNTTIASDADNTDDLGTSTFSWKDVYVRRILFDGSTSGTATIASDALSNVISGTVLSGTGTIPVEYDIYVRSDETLSASNADQPLFTNTAHDVITILANTTYDFEFIGDFTHGATSHDFQFGMIPTTATITNIAYYAILSSVAVGTPTTSQYATSVKATATTPINLAAANAVESVCIRGWFTVGNTGGTIQPTIQFSVDPTGTVLLKAGARMKIIPRGNDTFTEKGPIN